MLGISVRGTEVLRPLGSCLHSIHLALPLGFPSAWQEIHHGTWRGTGGSAVAASKQGAALACAVACARGSVGISGFLCFSLIILLCCCPDEDLFQRDKFADDV